MTDDYTAIEVVRHMLASGRLDYDGYRFMVRILARLRERSA
jgi:hypothetical protein